MRTPLAAIALAALMLTPAAAQAPVPPPAGAPTAAPVAAEPPAPRPTIPAAVSLALRICLAKPNKAEELTAEAEKVGFGPFIQRETQDPTGARLSYHKIAPGEFDGAPLLAVIRRRTITEQGQQPVEWTECGITFEPGGQNVPVAAELARTLGPGRAKGGAIGWAWRLTEGRPRQAIMLPPRTGWSPEVELAQTLSQSERIATLTVASAGRVTWIQVGYFRLKPRSEP